MDKTLGAYSILACRKAIDEAGVTPDQIDGVIYDSHIAGGSGGAARSGRHGPTRPALRFGVVAALVNAQWLVAQMGLSNVKFAPTRVPTISEMVGMAAHAVGDGICRACRHLPQRISKAAIVAVARTPMITPAAHANGRRLGVITAERFHRHVPHGRYCLKYGGSTTTLLPSSSTSFATGC